jgi:hypothetical protein
MNVAVVYIEELWWSGRMSSPTLAAERIRLALTSSNLWGLKRVNTTQVFFFIEALVQSNPDRFASL